MLNRRDISVLLVRVIGFYLIVQWLITSPSWGWFLWSSSFELEGAWHFATYLLFLGMGAFLVLFSRRIGALLDPGECAPDSEPANLAAAHRIVVSSLGLVIVALYLPDLIAQWWLWKPSEPDPTGVTSPRSFWDQQFSVSYVLLCSFGLALMLGSQFFVGLIRRAYEFGHKEPSES